MKRIIALMLALLMVGAVMAACGNSNNTATTETKAADSKDTKTVDASKDLANVNSKGKLVVGITDS